MLLSLVAPAHLLNISVILMFKSKCEYVQIYNDNYVYLALNYITQYNTETQIVM